MQIVEREDRFETSSGISLKRVYTREDIGDMVAEQDLGEPGCYPFTRGAHPDMFRERNWIIRVLCGESSPRETNKRLKLLTSAGQTAVDVIGDTPTLANLDSDHPLAAATMGTQGVPLCCLQDYLEMLDGIPIGKISVSFSVPYAFAIAGLACVARENGIPLGELRGSTVLAPLYGDDCSYATHQPIGMRIRLATDTIEFGTWQMPKYRPFLEDTYYISEAALTPVEEVTLGLIEARLLITEAMKRGLDIDEFAPRIAILVNVGMDFFEEIAKIRALRRIWARMMKDEYQAKNPRSWRAAITVHTSGLSLTAKGPINNVTRGAYEALAAILAGCQAMEISCFDEPIRTPSPEAAVVALRTQQIIAYESGVIKVVDPLGGSYFVEALTNELEMRILEAVKEIELRGNACELSEKGYFHAIFENATKRYQEAVSTGRKKIVKVNTLCNPSEEDSLLKESVETKVEVNQEQIEKIKELKAKRNKIDVKQALNEVYERTQNRSANLIPVIMEALDKGLTMGEITGAIRLSYGVAFDHFEMVKRPF